MMVFGILHQFLGTPIGIIWWYLELDNSLGTPLCIMWSNLDFDISFLVAQCVLYGQLLVIGHGHKIQNTMIEDLQAYIETDAKFQT